MTTNAWLHKPLGELCTYRPPKAEARKRLRGDSEVSFLPMVDLAVDVKHPRPVKTKPLSEVEGSYTYFADGDVLLAKITPCFQNGKLGIARELKNGVGFGSSEYIVLRPNEELDREYLYYFLSRDEFRKQGVERMGGSVGQQRVPPEFVLSELVPLPPLEEQRRIVGILDEAFAGIAVAKRNAEQNLQNARALFESHLQAIFTQRGDGWQTTSIGEQITLQRGFDITKAQQCDGTVPVVSSGGVKSFHDTAMVEGPGVVIGRKGTLGKVFYMPSEFWPHDTTLWVKDFKGNNPRFVYYLFKSLDVAHLNTGSANPALNRNVLHPIKISWPSLSSQLSLAVTLDALEIETQRLAALYQQKLTALDELKKSLLARAFAGELAVAPAKKPMSSTDIHVGILAMAYRAHEKADQCKHFGHVKAEKIAHMIESHLGIDLGRQPVKDAAGPNDYPHLRKIEHRASKTGVFNVKSQGDRYAFTPLDRMDDHITKTSTALRGRLPAIERMLSLMLPLNTKQAEILATVYAAWNNLLIDDAPITDEAIVLEARENWHPNKLNIPREKFFKAIGWIREKEIVPTGTGSRVNPRS